jgi:hypothetical protein
MIWATRPRIQVDRVACCWLISRWIDSSAEFVFADEAELPGLAAGGAHTFDARNATFRHELADDGSKYGEICSFQALAKHFKLLENDIALGRLADLVWAADIGFRIGRNTPEEGQGLWMVFRGLALLETTDQERMMVGSTIFDGLYQVMLETTEQESQ